MERRQKCLAINIIHTLYCLNIWNWGYNLPVLFFFFFVSSKILLSSCHPFVAKAWNCLGWCHYFKKWHYFCLGFVIWGGTGGWKAGHKPAMWAQSTEGQPYPGLHHEQRGQQVEGGDSAPLLCSGEMPPGVLRSALQPSAQERHGPAGVRPEEGHKDDQRDGAPLLWGKAERVGAVQHGEEKAPGRPYSCLPLPEGGLQESWGGTFYKGI